MKEILVAVSPGELIDRLTILLIKADRFPSGEKRDRARSQAEYHRLRLKEFLELGTGKRPGELSFTDPMMRLRRVNELIWEAEDAVRATDDEEQRKNASLRSHDLNEERYALKRQIDEVFNSEILEDKSYR